MVLDKVCIFALLECCTLNNRHRTIDTAESAIEEGSVG